VSWTVDKVMTRAVVTASPSTGYKELARRMSEYAISALPVVDLVGDEGRLVGIVSEDDLLAKKDPDPWRYLEARSGADEARA